MTAAANLFDLIQASFGELWHCQQRGKSLEVTTPFTTTSQKFVTVFVSSRDDGFVVSDGGWVNEGLYDTFIDENEDCAMRFFHHLRSTYSIQETTFSDRTFYYKKTTSEINIPSVILDVATFLSCILSASDMPVKNVENEYRERFSSRANTLLQGLNLTGRLKLNAPIKPNSGIHVSARIEKAGNKLILVNYVTGSQWNTFKSGINNTTTIFGIAQREIGEYIDRKVTLLDDEATGYVASRAEDLLAYQQEVTHAQVVNWSDYERLVSLL
jgi:hypothetical protein